MNEQAVKPPQTHEQTEHLVRRLGGEVFRSAVLIGSAAVRALLPAMDLPSGDVDLSVSPDAYAHLRGLPDWQELRLADGRNRLRAGTLDVGVGWYAVAHDELQQNGWRTPSGLTVAGPSYVYAAKQQRGSAADAYDTAFMRQSLLDPENPIVPAHAVERQSAMLWDCLPDRLRSHPLAEKAVRLAATGMMIAHTLYGDPAIGRANQIIGSLEKPEYRVPALYHNAFDLHRAVRCLVRHLEAIQASDEDILLAMAAETFADIVYGNGRKRDNPGAYDELLSAELLAAHAAQLEFAPEQIDLMSEAVVDTGFDEQTKAQAGTNHLHRVVRGVTGVDLQVLSEPDSLEASFCLAVEDGMSARYSEERIIGKVVVAKDVRLSTVGAGMEFIDEYGHARPVQDGPTVMEWFASRVFSSGAFHDPGTGHKPPHDWTPDNPELRREHRDKHFAVATALRQGSLSAQEAYREAQRHTARMRERYGEAA